MERESPAELAMGAILKHYGESVNPSQIPKPHRTVLLVFHADGILGNGGFHYLFEDNFFGDPEFLLTREAYKTINAAQALAAFAKAFALFPNSTLPSDIGARLEIYESHYTVMAAIEDPESPDALYFSSMDETRRLLDEYVLANQELFAGLS